MWSIVRILMLTVTFQNGTIHMSPQKWGGQGMRQNRTGGSGDNVHDLQTITELCIPKVSHLATCN